MSDDAKSCYAELANLYAYLTAEDQGSPTRIDGSADVLGPFLPTLDKITQIAKQLAFGSAESVEELIRPLGHMTSLPPWLCIPGHA
jgi:hypothetical protein